MFLVGTNRFQFLHHLPKNGVVGEIGVDRGDFSTNILQRLQPKKLHLIDVWETQKQETDFKNRERPPEQTQDLAFNSICERFESEISAGQVRLHRARSRQACASFPDGYFDALYIDGAREYEAVLEDLTNYARKVRAEGVLMGHDLSNHYFSRKFGFGVLQALSRFLEDNPDWKILFLDDHHWTTFVLGQDVPNSWGEFMFHSFMRSQISLIEIPDLLLRNLRQVRTFNSQGEQKFVTSFSTGSYLDKYAEIEDQLPAVTKLSADKLDEVSPVTGSEIVALAQAHAQLEQKNGYSLPRGFASLQPLDAQQALLKRARPEALDESALIAAYGMAVRLEMNDERRALRKHLDLNAPQVLYWDVIQAFKDRRPTKEFGLPFLASNFGSRFERAMVLELLVPEIIKTKDWDATKRVRSYLDGQEDLRFYANAIDAHFAYYQDEDVPKAIDLCASAPKEGLFRFRGMVSILSTELVDAFIDAEIDALGMSEGVSKTLDTAKRCLVALVCCDGSYFRRMAALFVQAFRIDNPKTRLRVVVYNLPDADQTEAKALADEFGFELQLEVSVNTARHFYASARFFHAADLMRDENVDVVTLDIDNCVCGHLPSIFSEQNTDLGLMFVRYEPMLFWQLISVDCVLFRSTPSGRVFMGAISRYLNHLTPASKTASENLWWVDQSAFFCIYARMMDRGFALETQQLYPIRPEVFYQPHEKTLLWLSASKEEILASRLEGLRRLRGLVPDNDDNTEV